MLDARGVVEPYREPDRGRGWLVLMIGVIVFALFGGVVGAAWFSGMLTGAGEPPLVRANPQPYRHAPGERGGIEVANRNSSIVSVLEPKEDAPRVERLLPPEVPMAVEATEPEAVVEPQPVPPPLADAEQSLPAAEAPALPADAQTEPTAPPADGSAPSATATAEPPAPPLPANVPMPVPRPRAEVGDLALSSTERAAQPAPPPTAARTPAPPAATARAPAPPAAARTPAPSRPSETAVAARTPATSRPAEPPAVAPPGEGIYRLQLTAVRSETGLTQAWAQLRQQHASVLGSTSPKVERTETSSGPLFRLQAGPFRTRESAANACSVIRAGGGQCFIVGPIAQ